MINTEQTCTVTCTDTNRSVTSVVDKYVPGKELTVIIEKSIKVKLVYDVRNKIYVGNKSGLEFTTTGPK